jgi:hypothetical protein
MQQAFTSLTTLFLPFKGIFIYFIHRSVLGCKIALPIGFTRIVHIIIENILVEATITTTAIIHIEE